MPSGGGDVLLDDDHDDEEDDDDDDKQKDMVMSEWIINSLSLSQSQLSSYPVIQLSSDARPGFNDHTVHCFIKFCTLRGHLGAHGGTWGHLMGHMDL